MYALRNEISSEIKFRIIAFIWAIIYSVTQYEQEDLALKVWGRNQFYHNSGMPNSMMQLLMLLTTLNEISLYITICFK